MVGDRKLDPSLRGQGKFNGFNEILVTRYATVSETPLRLKNVRNRLIRKSKNGNVSAQPNAGTLTSGVSGKTITSSFRRSRDETV